MKFSNKGQRVDVRLRRTESTYEIRVTDSGRGIDARFLPHVFDPFRQADAIDHAPPRRPRPRPRDHPGAGRASRRQDRADSEGEGRGATFVVTLPCRPERIRRWTRIGRARGERTGWRDLRELEGLRVLVVDDEEDARVLVRTILEECGCSVRAASSAAEAMGVIESATVDVLVSDIGMPEEDGYSLMRRVRTLGLPRGALPAIALTAFTRSEDRRRALEAGFARHVAKPVDPAELVAVVASLMRSVIPEGEVSEVTTHARNQRPSSSHGARFSTYIPACTSPACSAGISTSSSQSALESFHLHYTRDGLDTWFRITPALVPRSPGADVHGRDASEAPRSRGRRAAHAERDGRCAERRPRDPHAPKLGSSCTSSSTEGRMRALLAVFQSHVAKPVEPADLLVVIANVAARVPKP